MNIVIPTIGTRGDVQPFIALAQGLIGAENGVENAVHLMKATFEQPAGGRRRLRTAN